MRQLEFAKHYFGKFGVSLSKESHFITVSDTNKGESHSVWVVANFQAPFRPSEVQRTRQPIRQSSGGMRELHPAQPAQAGGRPPPGRTNAPAAAVEAKGCSGGHQGSVLTKSGAARTSLPTEATIALLLPTFTSPETLCNISWQAEVTCMLLSSCWGSHLENESKAPPPQLL